MLRTLLGILSTLILGCASDGVAVSPAAGGVDAGSDDTLTAADVGADSVAPPTTPGRILFDATKGEQSGNADWVIDSSGQFPAPQHPNVESDWLGGISAWGVAIHRAGYAVEVLPRGARISFADASNTQDLSHYDVYVVPEPNNAFTATEAAAMVEFVKAGGGLFLIADHGKSDRDGDGWDAPRAWNDVFDRTGDPFGIRFSADNITDSPDDNVLDDPSSRLLHGAFGDVRATTYYNGSTMRLDQGKNPSVRALIWKRGVPRENQYVTFAIAELGKGRVAAIGDSSPADDGTGSGKLQNGWDDPNGNNRALFLNATAWLAHRE